MNARRQAKILVVDDEIGFTRLLKIAAANYQIRTVNDPEQAVGAALEFEPDIVFLDRIMPRMSGEDLAAAIQAHPRLSKTPIVIVTGSPPKEGAGTFASQLNGWPVLTKPVSLCAIDECVERLLGG